MMQSQIKTYSRKPLNDLQGSFISKKGSETRYLATYLIPTEILLKISPDSINVICNYSTPERFRSIKRDGKFERVFIMGKYSGVILNIRASFQPGNFTALIAAMDEVIKDIHGLSAKALRKSVKKSYAIVVGALTRLKDEVLKSQTELEAFLKEDE